MSSGPFKVTQANPPAKRATQDAGGVAAQPAAKLDSRRRISFPALDALRFLAAAAVIIHHVEQFKDIQGEPSAWGCYPIEQLGLRGVDLFFVLSAFLLTHLMLEEIAVNGQVSVRQFYLRRALRIVPPYALIVAISFLIIPLVAPYLFSERIAACVAATIPQLPFAFCFYALMVPNFSFNIVPMIVGASQSWSIGTEVQFYSFFPHLVNRYRKEPWKLLVAFKVIVFIVPLAVLTFYKQFHLLRGLNPIARHIPYFFATICAQMDFMFIGAAAAVLFRCANPMFIAALYHPAARMVLFLTVGFYISQPLWQPYWVLGITFGLLTISMTDAALKFPLQNLVQSIGRISYGVYMYHCIVICTVLHLIRLEPFARLIDLQRNVIAYGLIFTITILISALSYRFFESPILRLKRRFSTVVSGAG
ncbi:MAG: acyltransferase family protein [Terriglobales bacterium]